MKVASRVPKKDVTDRLAEEYGKETVTRNIQEKARARYVVLEPSQFDDDKVIDMLEKSPTFNRDTKFRTEIKEMAKTTAAAEEQAPRRQADDATASTPTIQF